MTDILVDLDQLRLGAAEIDGVADEVNAAAVEAGKAALGGGIDSSYAAQLAGKLEGYGVELLTQASSIVSSLREHATWLQDLAQRFQEADLAAVEGMDSLWAISGALLVEYGESPYVMRWLLDGARPPWMDPKMWWLLSEEDRQAMLQGYRRQWAQFLASRTAGSFRPSEQGLPHLDEAFEIYRNGLPEDLFDPTTGQQIAPYLPLPLFSIPHMESGLSYLDPLTRRPRFSRYQYQDLEEYIDRLRYSDAPGASALAEQIASVQQHPWSRAHYNLCGLDSVGYAAGVDEMMEAYINFAEIDQDMLVTNDTAWTYEIRDLYRRFGWEAEQIGRFAGDEHNVWLHWNEEHRLAYPTFEDVTDKLDQGYAITPLVGVDSSLGTLSANPEAAVGHFVTITETMVTSDGTELIRVYNSLEHREEIYTWETFDRVWMHAGGNSGGQAVIARPPGAVP